MNDNDPPIKEALGGFGAVTDALRRNLIEGEDLGASFCLAVGGEVVAEVHGGYVDQKRETPWTEETLACVYSSGKAVISLLIASAVSDGLLDYEAPIADIWPEFAVAGKETITLAQVMSHQGGLAAFMDEMAPGVWLDWERVCERLAAMAPLWPPGTRSGYHPQTFGFIAGEALRRVRGRTIGRILREDWRGAGVDVICGAQSDDLARIAAMKKPPKAPDLGALNPIKLAAFAKPWSSPARVSREEWLAAEIPASNMIATARGLATAVHAFANDGVTIDGRKLLSGEALEGALRERVYCDDCVLPFSLSWAAGLMRNTLGHFGPSPTAFGHAGFGGSCVVVDPARRLSAAYVMNAMSPHLVGDPRAIRLIEAAYKNL